MVIGSRSTVLATALMLVGAVPVGAQDKAVHVFTYGGGYSALKNLDDIGADINLSDVTKQTILNYPLPDQQPAEKFAAFTYLHTDTVRPICGTVHNVASSEMLYCSSTTGAHFERRAKELKSFADPVEAIVKFAAGELRQDKAGPVDDSRSIKR